jgi:hypothetical protein
MRLERLLPRLRPLANMSVLIEHITLVVFSLLSFHTSTCFGRSAAHHQEVECICVANGTYYAYELTVSGPSQTL